MKIKKFGTQLSAPLLPSSVCMCFKPHYDTSRCGGVACGVYKLKEEWG